MFNPQAHIENHPAGTGNLNSIINGNWGNIVEWFNIAAALTASQTTTTVTASATVFTSDMVGAVILFANGASATISAYTSGTVVTVTPSQSVSSQAFAVYRTDQVPRTALARGLMKLHRFVTADDGKQIHWDQTLLKFVFNFGMTYKQATISYAASVALDFDSNAMQTVALTGNITFTTSNKAAGRRKIVRIVGDGSTRTFTFPSWTFLGAAAPANIAAGKVALLQLDCFGTAESDVLARYTVSP